MSASSAAAADPNGGSSAYIPASTPPSTTAAPARQAGVGASGISDSETISSMNGAAAAASTPHAAAWIEGSSAPHARTTAGSRQAKPATAETRVSASIFSAAGISESTNSPPSASAQPMTGISETSLSGSRNAPSMQPTTAAAALRPDTATAHSPATASGDARSRISARVSKNMIAAMTIGSTQRMASRRADTRAHRTRRAAAAKPVSTVSAVPTIPNRSDLSITFRCLPGWI